MGKGLKIALNIIYYVSMVLFGIVLVIILPTIYMYNMPVEHISKSLTEENYSDAMKLIGGYFNDEYIVSLDSDVGKVVLFETIALENTEDENDKSKINSRLYNAFSGFVYDTKGHFDSVDGRNKAKLIVISDDECTHEIEIVDLDSDQDGSLDSITTIPKHDFFYFEIPEEIVTNVKTFYFIDSKGDKGSEINIGKDYNSDFFNQAIELVTEYNQDYNSDDLEALDQAFRNNSSHYQKSDDLGLPNKADKKASIVVLIYFICVYIVGDITIGFRFIIKGIKFILVKVFKIKVKEKQPNLSRQEIFGHDYYCQVTFKADVSEAPDLTGPITIKYSNENSECEFSLLSGEDFSVTKRVKAGTYVNPWFSVMEGYEIINAPERLRVEGYSIDILIKIRKKEKNGEEL